MQYNSTQDIKDLARDLDQTAIKVSQDDTPILNAMPKGRAVKNPLNVEITISKHRASTGNNAVLEGADVTEVDKGDQPEFPSNICQIQSYTYGETGTVAHLKPEAMDGHTLKEQIRADIEIHIHARKEAERTIMQNQASRSQSGSNPRLLAGLPSFMEDNVSRGTGGSNGGYSNGTTSEATDGEERYISEDILNNVIKSMKDNGAETSRLSLYVGTFNKQYISKTFNGYNTRNIEMTKDGALNSAVSIYNHDFGSAQVKCSHEMNPTDAFLINFDHFKLAKYRWAHKNRLAKTGDSDKFQIVYEYTTEVDQRGLGLIADCKTS